MSDKNIYQRLFEGWTDPRFLIEEDETGFFRVLKANKSGCEYFAQPDGSLDGNLLDDLLEATNKDHIVQTFTVAFRTGMPLTVQVIPVFPGGVRIRSFYISPIKDEAGKVIAVDMVARLIVTDENSLTRERDDAMSIFATIFDTSDIGIMVTDPNRRIVRVNDALCKTFGWQPIELLGHEFTEFMPKDEHQISLKRHQELMGGANIERSRELQVIKKDGTIANVIVSSGGIELSGSRKFRVSTVVNITHLKKIELDLRRAKEMADGASKAKSTFLANMSHELRTPLNAIIGFSDLMIAGTLGQIENPHYREYMGDIKFSALHLLDIINDVLDMSKIEAGQMKLSLQETDIEAMIDESVRLMRTRATESGVMLKTDIEAGLLPVNIDQRMIRQVLLNLISNAVKFSGGRGSVLLKATAAKDNYIAVSVTDQGIGIPEDKLSEVMQPFGQVQDARVNGGQGTGLGLPLARTMVELHSGVLTIASKMDAGTTVTFTLPTTAKG